MTTIAIVISTENGGIGINGRMPWMTLFTMKDAHEELAVGNVVLVGRNSFTSHEHLRGDITYVYTTDETFEETDTVKRVSGDPEAVINKIKEENPDKNIIISGGEAVFKAFYDLIDEWRVTFINEFVVFNRDLNITDIQHRWNKRRLVSTGEDNNQNFSVYHFTK